jgi:hypothetical protein
LEEKGIFSPHPLNFVQTFDTIFPRPMLAHSRSARVDQEWSIPFGRRGSALTLAGRTSTR